MPATSKKAGEKQGMKKHQHYVKLETIPPSQ